LERLALDGWVGGRQAAEAHEDPLDKRMCLWKGFAKAPAYLLCLVRWQHLWAKGLRSFPSGQHNAFYLALLSSADPAALLPGQAVAKYEEIIVGSGPLQPLGPLTRPLADAPRGFALDDFEAEPQAVAFCGLAILPPAPLTPASQSSAPDGDGSDFADEPETVVFLPAVVAAEEPVNRERAAAARVLAEADRLQELWRSLALPSMVEGVALRLEVQPYPSRGPCYIRRRVTCRNAAHGPTCGRSRNVTFVSAFGQREVVAYLAAWLRGSFDVVRGASRASHVAFKPSLAEVEAYVLDAALPADN
jgi:hypothetical protein